MSAAGEPIRDSTVTNVTHRTPTLNFLSDNAWGTWPEMLQALTTAASGSQVSYGQDDITARLEARFAELFEHPLRVFPVVSGTAANALALATLVPGHGAVLCHEASHIAVDECGAVEFYAQGAKLITLPGEDGKLSPHGIGSALARFQRGVVHHSQPAAISIAQATAAGTVYTPAEIAAVAEVARGRGLKVHLDGARLANALAHLNCSPAEITWRAGVDVLSFGATKGGALGAEAVVFFDPVDAGDFEYRRKRGGHLVSKMRFFSAQLETFIAGNAWIEHARRANMLAQSLARGLAGIAGAELAYPVQSNAVFVRLPDEVVARMRTAGVQFYNWEAPREGRTLIRLLTSFATPEADIDKLVALARS